MDDYVQTLNKRGVIRFSIVTILILASQTLIAYRLDNDFPFWVMIIISIIIAGAFYFGLRLGNDKLSQLAGASFFIDNNIIKQQTANNVITQLKLSEIAIINKKYSGTILVKGGVLTRIDYMRPKKTSPYQIGSPDTIFIPSITSNYWELVDKIKELSTQAAKL
ncbi:MAG: hypothetical protein EPN39_10490 [Chitinophagaceae bacterium]|nr:MAG: hypothetical protein EPN39_10490 [Chitinophagaceae bacterium]